VMGMLHHTITLEEAIRSGMSRSRVYRLLEKGEWVRLRQGVFLTDPSIDPQARWRSELFATLRACGDGALVSHRSAAILHRLEGVQGRPIDVTVARNVTRRPPDVRRTMRPDPKPVLLDGLPTTSLARTILDLGTAVPGDVVEQALESALRGPDPLRPDVWNEALFHELQRARIVPKHTRATIVLAAVLGRRQASDRPTGSFPETLLVQALRARGLVAVRQASVRIVDADGNKLDRFFPDLSFPELGLLVEVDGASVHANSVALARDLQRQNKLARGFRMLRFPAAEVMRSPGMVADGIVKVAREMKPRGSRWTEAGASISYTRNEFVLRDATRGRRRRTG
jgi:very-short-patch-repair endonuclease